MGGVTDLVRCPLSILEGFDSSRTLDFLEGKITLEKCHARPLPSFLTFFAGPKKVKRQTRAPVGRTREEEGSRPPDQLQINH
jgi:hypothetical protein